MDLTAEGGSEGVAQRCAHIRVVEKAVALGDGTVAVRRAQRRRIRRMSSESTPIQGGSGTYISTAALQNSSHRIASQPLLFGVSVEKGEDELGEKKSAVPHDKIKFAMVHTVYEIYRSAGPWSSATPRAARRPPRARPHRCGRRRLLAVRATRRAACAAECAACSRAAA